MKTLAICDLESSKANLMGLSNKIKLSKVLLFDEVSNEELNTVNLEYSVLIFVLNPENIGNWFFMERMKRILEKRKMTKSVFFWIDGKEKLSRAEVLEAQLEVERTLQEMIETPSIYCMDTQLAATYYDYTLGRLTLSDIQKQNTISLIDQEGFCITGRAITAETVEHFWDYSEVDAIITCIEEVFPKFETINITKRVVAVYGNRQCGKSTMIRLLESLGNDVQYMELTSLEHIQDTMIDSLLVLLDYNHEQNKRILKEVERISLEYQYQMVVNKLDQYMLNGECKEDFIKHITAYTRECMGTAPAFLLSGYYAERWLAFEAGAVSVEDLMQDEELLFIDEYGLPLIQYKSHKNYVELFARQNYIKELKEMGETLCLNHI